MEKLRGVDALKNYSFRDITLPFNDGLDLLTQNAKLAFTKNIQSLIDRPYPESEEVNTYKERLKIIQTSVDSYVAPGGICFSKDELLKVYGEMGHLNFKDVVDYTLSKVSPNVIVRGYPNIIIGYTIDCLTLIKTDIATFDDGVSEVLDLLKLKKINMFELGTMLDDAIELRGTPKLDFDYLGDSKKAAQIKESVFKLLTSEETISFVQGLQITRSELMRLNNIQ